MLILLFCSLFSLAFSVDTIWTDTYNTALLQCRRCLDHQYVVLLDRYFMYLNDTVHYNFLYAHTISRLGHTLNSRQHSLCHAIHEATLELLQTHQHEMSLIENYGKQNGWPKTLEHMNNLNVNITKDCEEIKSMIELNDVRFCLAQLRKNAMKKLVIEQTQL